MKEDILINITPQETRIAIVSEGATQELHIERSQTRGLAGNVYLGRVVRVLPGMQSGLCRYRSGACGFSPYRRHTGSPPNRYPLGKTGSDRTDAFGWTIRHGTCHQRSAGHQGCTAFDPDFHCRPHAGLSAAGKAYRHITAHSGRKERESLKHRVQQLLSDNEKGGFIIRTMRRRRIGSGTSG